MNNNRYENQPDPVTFAYKYNIPAAEGEMIVVTATCSIFGSKTVTMTVGKVAQ